MTIPGPSDEIAAHEMEGRKSLRRLDASYACYALVGLTVIAGMGVDLADKGNQEGYAMLVTLMLGPLALLAFVVAIVLTLMSRRHRPVVVLCLVTVLLLALKVAVDLSNCCSGGASEVVLDVVAWTYGALAVLVSAWWFMKGRRREKNAT